MGTPNTPPPPHQGGWVLRVASVESSHYIREGLLISRGGVNVIKETEMKYVCKIFPSTLKISLKKCLDENQFNYSLIMVISNNTPPCSNIVFTFCFCFCAFKIKKKSKHNINYRGSTSRIQALKYLLLHV